MFCLAGSDVVANISRTPAEADHRAIRTDWAMVGQDLEKVLAENSHRLTEDGR